MHFLDIHTHQSGKPFAVFNDTEIRLEVHTSCSLGIHPWYVTVHWEEKLRQIQELSLSRLEVVGIGEAGFDRLKGPEISLQKGAFYAQARWAKALGIPLILHCVKAHDLILEYFSSEKNPPPIIWHGWNLKPALARQLLSYPVFFSFGKHLLLEGSNAQKWLLECPKERLFFETDDSGLEIDSIYRAASLLLHLPLDRLADQVESNWNHLSKRKIS